MLLSSAAAVVVALLLLNRFALCNLPYVCGPLTAPDVAQGRLDTALPAPQDTFAIDQTFVPRRNGLSEIELLLVRYGEAPPPEGSRFIVELWDGETRVAVQAASQAQLAHNQPYSLSFPPLRDSAGRRYTLRLLGSNGGVVSAWGYSLDVYPGGDLTLSGGAPGASLPARELRFITRYALTAEDALAAVIAPVINEGGLLLAALLLVPLPGVLLLLLFRPRGWDGGAWLGVALALGVAAWPLLWFWLTLAGGRWTAASLWAALVAGWLAALGVVVWRRRRGRQTTNHRRQGVIGDELALDGGALPAVVRGWSSVAYPALLALLLTASLAARFIAVRDLAFAPWVDSSRHALITAVMIDTGQTPDDYGPYLPVDHFPYHFGFHTLSAGLALLTGRPLPGLLLTLGQWLNGLVPLTVYAAAWLVTRRRAVALLAAFLVALPFFFPGYYATWGRMTQLAAMLIMPALLALTWRLGRGWPRYWPLVGVLAAGLFLIHFRVFLFYMPFAALAAVAHFTGRRRIAAMLKAGALALLLVLPRLAALLADTDPLQTVSQSQPGYNDFPLGYVTTGWERLYLGMVVVAALILLIAAIRRQRWVAFPLLLAGWVGVLFVLLAGNRLGLPETLVVNLNSMYITLFLPLSLFLAIVAGESWRAVDRWLRRTTADRRLVRAALAAAAGIALGLLALFGWRQQVNILNQQTILALPEDAAALEWMSDNLPPGSRVAVNAWQWLGATWAGSDGGAWLTPLTGLEATTPPVDHIYDPALFARVRAFNEAALQVEDWGDPAAADWLRAQGVTHVFVGQRGGFLDPAELSRNPRLALLFQSEGTFVFAVE